MMVLIGAQVRMLGLDVLQLMVMHGNAYNLAWVLGVLPVNVHK